MSKLKEIIHQYVVEALEEILSEEVEQISEARKLIKHYKSPEADMEAKVYKNPETGEHEVDFYKNGKNLGEGPRYYTDSLKDAHTTAQTGLKRMQKRHPVEESADQINELSDDLLYSYKRQARKAINKLNSPPPSNSDSPRAKQLEKRVKGYRLAWDKLERK